MTAVWMVQEPDGSVHEYDPRAERPDVGRVLVDRSGGAAGVEPRFSAEAVRLFDELKRRGGSASRGALREGFGGPMRGQLSEAIADLVRVGVLEWNRERVYGQVAAVGSMDSPQLVLRLREGWEDLMLVSSWSRFGS